MRCGLFDVVDGHDVQQFLARFERESKLLPGRGEE